MNWYKSAQSPTGLSVWLDDLRDPNDPYIQQHFGTTGNEIWVKTIDEAIELINSGDVSSISLDNDLGEGIPEGYKVAEYIEEKAFNGEVEPLEVHVHSANPVRAKDMMSAIENAQRFWFRSSPAQL